jgi:hypothetical protein
MKKIMKHTFESTTGSQPRCLAEFFVVVIMEHVEIELMFRCCFSQQVN